MHENPRPARPGWVDQVREALSCESDSQHMTPIESRYFPDERRLMFAFASVSILGGRHDGAVVRRGGANWYLDFQPILALFDALPQVSVSDGEIISMSGKIGAEDAWITFVPSFEDAEPTIQIKVGIGAHM